MLSAMPEGLRAGRGSWGRGSDEGQWAP